MKKLKCKRLDKPIAPVPKITPEEEREIDYEICWCIEKLEGMLSKNISDKEKKQCQRSLKILSNPETPLISKRQVMRQQFGDYKKVIAKDKNSGLKYDIKFKKTETSLKSTFIRKHQVHDGTKGSNEVSLECEKKISGIPLSDNSFRFNFGNNFS